MEDVFHEFDKNSDGFISAPELKHCMSHIGEKITLEEAEAIIAEFDVDGNGKVNMKEFMKMWKNM